MAATSNIFTGDLTPEQIAGTPASIKSQSFVDPLKQAVASPLSAFLASQIGQGIPTYDKPTAAGYDPGAASNISKFLASDANSNFDTNVGNPAIKNFQDILLPDIREGYAGALSSSGRTSGESQAAQQLLQGLSAQKAQYGIDYTKAQGDLAGQLQAGQTAPLKAAYDVWLNSQSQGNAQLKSALDFLNNTTSSGTTVTAALDPGTAGLYGQIFGAQVAQNALDAAKGKDNVYNTDAPSAGSIAANSQLKA